MEFITTNFENLIYIYEHIFWLKECLTLLQSALVFLLVLWILRRKQKIEFLIYLSACNGIACVFFGDNEYWSGNDILKFIAPAALYFFYCAKEKERNALLFAFFIPYSIITYEFYRGLEFALASIITHSMVIFSIIIAKNIYYLSLFISVVVILIIHYIGVNTPPSTSEVLLNPALITLATIWLEIYRKNPLYTNFLKIFWITLICFAYFGSWLFYFIQPFIASFFQPNHS